MAHTLIAHAEIPTKNPDKAKEFFKNVFGWEFKPFGKGYQLFNTHKGLTVGLRTAENLQSGDTTIFHVYVDSIDETLTKVESYGGKTERKKTVIPAMGWYALIRDADNNIIGLYESNK